MTAGKRQNDGEGRKVSACQGWGGGRMKVGQRGLLGSAVLPYDTVVLDTCSSNMECAVSGRALPLVTARQWCAVQLIWGISPHLQWDIDSGGCAWEGESTWMGTLCIFGLVLLQTQNCSKNKLCLKST